MLVLRIVLAAIFCAIGLAGLLLPVLPGWLFFFFAFGVLAPQHRYTKKAVAWVGQRAPRTARMLRWMGLG